MTIDPPKPLWTPSRPQDSQLAKFQTYIADKYDQEEFSTCPQRPPLLVLN
jgi:hypothetical protein